MSMLQIGILGVAGVLLALQFKSGKSEYGIYISIALAVLGSVILQMIPDHGFQKYVRFVLGLILAAMLVVPVLELFDKRAAFEEIYHNSAYKIRTSELEEKSQKVQEDILDIDGQNVENQNIENSGTGSQNTEDQIQDSNTDRSSDENVSQNRKIEVEQIEIGKESE